MITLTREEAQQVLDALSHSHAREPIWKTPLNTAIETLRARLRAPEPDYRDVVIKGDLWRIEFLPDHAASVVLVRANYEAQPEPEPVADKYLMEVECTKCGAKQDGILTVNAPPQRNEPEPVMLMDAPLLLNGQPLYTAPAQREWQGLTDEEVEIETARVLTTLTKDVWPIALSRAIEELLRRKNT